MLQLTPVVKLLIFDTPAAAKHYRTKLRQAGEWASVVPVGDYSTIEEREKLCVGVMVHSYEFSEEREKEQ